MKFPLVCLSILMFTGCFNKQQKPFAYPLKDLKGELTHLKYPVNGKGMVLVFLVPDCPFSQLYSMAVNQVYSMFYKKGFAFYGIVPGQLYTLSEIDSFKSRYNFIPEILLDSAYHYSKQFEVNVVPQVLVLDAVERILYSGKIDDQAVNTGVKRYAPKHYYLLNALKSINKGKAVEIKETKAVGCYIE